MNPGHRRSKYRKTIDQWWFATDTKFHDKEIVVFNIVLCRDADMQEGGGPIAKTPRAKFEANFDRKNSSPHIKGDVEIEDDDFNKLRRKCQQAFEEMTAKEWVKIILVSCKSDEGHFRVNRELEFAFGVCERAGDLYRREDGWVTRSKSELVGGGHDNIREIPWSEETERSLAMIDQRLQELGVAIDKLIQDPERLNLVVKNMPALLK